MEDSTVNNCLPDGGCDLLQDGNLSADGSGPLSRSSVTHVASIVAKFDEVKRELVRETGFQGILELPQISKVDRKFTLWLLTKLDGDSKCIIVNEQVVTDVIDFEVSRILGIPCGRRQVCTLESVDKKSKLHFIQNIIGASDADTNSLIAAERNVTASYALPMSKKDVDNFKASFVVWVIGHLLAPTKKHNVGSDRFWGALMVPNEIKSYNWAAYVLEEIFLAAKDVQLAIKQKKPITTITGCSILLQILYFESINMGNLNRPRGILPRVKVYDSKSLSLMIAADKASSSSGSENPTWGSTLRAWPDDDMDEAEHVHSHTQMSSSANEGADDKEIIKEFSGFIRHKFADKVSQEQSCALGWFHARCTRHINQLRLRIQEDTIDLVDKLFRPSPSTCGSRPTKQYLSPSKQGRLSGSEPLRTLNYGRSILNSKRTAHSTTPSARTRGAKKVRWSQTNYTLPETLLTGCSRIAYETLDDQISDNEQHSVVPRETSDSDRPPQGIDIPVPSFDLGLDFDDITDKTSAPTVSVNGQICEHIAANEHIPNSAAASIPVESDACILDSSVGSQSPSGCDNKKEKHQVDTSIHHAGVEVISSCELSLSTTDHLSGKAISDPDNHHDMLSNQSQVSISTDSSSFITPVQLMRRSKTSPGTLSKLMAEGDLFARMTRDEDSPNINISPWDQQYSNSPIQRRIIFSQDLVESPWDMNICHRSPPKDIVEKLFEDVSATPLSSLNRTWIAHESPRQIEINGSRIHQVFISQKPMCYDVFDLALRRLKQLDEIMYSNKTGERWRHVMESELAMLALAGECSYDRKSIVEQFTGSSVAYPLEKCRMVVVPAFILMNWSCYFFDFNDHRVHVIDPLFNKADSNLLSQLHTTNVSRVAASFANCIEKFFENWQHNIQDWGVHFVEPTVLDATPVETGLLTLLYIREFDGCKIHNASRDTLDDFKKVMLYELLSLRDSYVKPPLNFTISIE